MSRKLIALSLALILLLGALPTLAQEPVKIVWFVGLGTGAQPEQQEMQQAVVDRFNEMQDDIVLELQIAPEYEAARDTIATLIAAGQSPDIVGPVGTTGANAFKGFYLDLEPLVEATGYDLTQFPEAAVDFYRTDEGLVGLPFGTFPEFLWYRPAMFDEAGLDYPPAAYGEPYADGDEWSYDKIRELGLLLTVDANGNDATMEEFDPENVVQWGFVIQWSDPLGYPIRFEPNRIVDDEGNAQMPEAWREFFHWYYDGIWVDHFIPNGAQVGSDLLGAGNPFSSGNVAMAVTHLWYTCCIADDQWQAAAMPSHNGRVVAKLHADTFRILNTSQHPEEAFEVLTYLIGDAALDLLSVYGGMPARPEDTEAYFAALDEKYPQGVNWDVVVDSLNYPDNPSHESWMPNFNKAQDRLLTFRNYIENTPDLDIDAELDTLVADLQAIFDEVAED